MKQNDIIGAKIDSFRVKQSSHEVQLTPSTNHGPCNLKQSINKLFA